MSIHPGRPPSENFAMIPNHWFRDPNLSGKAKGYMGYIATHSVGYQLSIQQMITEMAEGKDAVYAGLNELVERGYLVRVQSRDSGRKFGEVDYHFGPAAQQQSYQRAWGTKEDVSAGQTASGFSGYGFPGHGSSGSGFAESKKTNPQKTNLKKASSAVASSSSATATKSAAPRRGEDDDEARERRIQKRKSGEARKAVAEVIRRLGVTRDEADLLVAFLVAEATESGDPIRNVAAFVAGCPDDDLEAHLVEAQCRQEPAVDDPDSAAEARRVRAELEPMEPDMDDVELDTIAAAFEAALRRGCEVNDVIRTINAVRNDRGRRSPTAVAAAIIAAIKAVQPESDAERAA